MNKVSIITVCYNSDRFISSAINSVLSQLYDNIEYIIIDGDSKDDTVSLVQSYGHKIDKFISESDKGIYDAMNKGLSLATGDIIGILNSDDFYVNDDVISLVVEKFKQNPDVDMILGNVDFVKPYDLSSPVRLYSSLGFAPWKMRFGFMPAHPAAFMKQSAYEKVGFYASGYEVGADFEWFVRALIKQKLSYTKLNRVLVRMREGGASTSGLKSYWLNSKEQIRALRSNNIYTNVFLIVLRLPIKLIQKLLIKY